MSQPRKSRPESRPVHPVDEFVFYISELWDQIVADLAHKAMLTYLATRSPWDIDSIFGVILYTLTCTDSGSM